MKRLLLITILAVLGVALSAQEAQKKSQFQLLTGFEGDVYSKPSYREFTVLHGGFGYKGNLTAVYGKVNLGYLYKESVDGLVIDKIDNQLQFELDYWQSFSKSKSTSIWINYAYSQDQLFPNHRIIFELWQKLGGGFLVSGGVNHFRFIDSDNATFVNAGLEKYMGRFWVEGKTYLYLKEPDITASYSLTGRVFFKDVNYLQLGASMGSAQDEPFLIEEDLDRQYAYSGNVKYTTNIFNERMRIAMGFTYMYEQYVFEENTHWRNRYAFGVGLIYNITK
jgi:YaiO family outer membrane protein